MLPQPQKTWTPVSPEPAAPLVASSTECRRITHLRLTTKVRVYVAVVISTLLYAAETWLKFYRKYLQLLECFHQRCPRSIMGIRKKYLTNVEVLERVGLPSIEDMLLQ